MTSNIFIVVLNWNGWQDTVECLTSLSLLESKNYVVIVVDNDSSDCSAKKILDWAANDSNELNLIKKINQKDLSNHSYSFNALDMIFIQSANNGGFAAGNNLGIRFALDSDCDYVWLLNNDTVVEAKSLSGLELLLKSDNKIGMAGSILRYYDNPNIVQAIGGVDYNFWIGRGHQLGEGLHYLDPKVKEVSKITPTYIAGASMFISRDFLNDVGLMSEDYFLYFEEIDWAVRSSLKWRLSTALESVVYHKEGGSIGTSSRKQRSKLSQYYLMRNQLRFYMLRKKALLPIAFIQIFRELIKLTIKKEKELLYVTLAALKDAVMLRSGRKD